MSCYLLADLPEGSTANKSLSAALAVTNSIIIDGLLEGRLDVVANVLQILTCSAHGLRRGYLPCKQTVRQV